MSFATGLFVFRGKTNDGDTNCDGDGQGGC